MVDHVAAHGVGQRTGVVPADPRTCRSLRGQVRFDSENFVLLANSAVLPPALCTAMKTDATRVPAAACTVRGRGRSSFQVTP